MMYLLHQRMKILPPSNQDTPIWTSARHTPLESYIYNTKELIADNLVILCLSENTNLHGPHQAAAVLVSEEKNLCTYIYKEHLRVVGTW